MDFDSTPPRIIFAALAAYGSVGVIQRFNRRIISALAGMVNAADTLVLGDRQSDVANVVGQGTKIGAGGSYLGFLLAFLRLGMRADVLLLGHINLLPLALIYRMLRPRGRVILFAHGIEVWGAPYRRPRRWEPSSLRYAVDRIAVVSAYSRQEMARVFGLPMNRFVLFPNAVDVLPMPERQIRSRTVIAVSRLAATEREKHVDKLIRALPKVRETVPDARLVIVGEGVLRDELRNLAAEIGVVEHVDLPGFLSDNDLTAAYARAAVFALPSSKEGFGIVYLEAWLKGLPVIASRFGAGGEVVTDGVDGYTIDPMDIDALAGAIAELLSGSEIAEKFAAAGREKVERQFSGEIFIANLRQLIEQ